MTKAKSNQKSQEESQEPSLESLDKVRELLFGSQLGAVESKINSAEKQLGVELKTLNAQTQASIDSLEKFTRDELDSLAQQIAEERTRREDQGDDLSAELERNSKSLEKKITTLDDKLTETSKNLRQQSHDAVKELREQTKNQFDSMHEYIKATDARLSEERVHRDVLANLFREVASQLDSEPLTEDSVVKAVKDADAE